MVLHQSGARVSSTEASPRYTSGEALYMGLFDKVVYLSENRRIVERPGTLEQIELGSAKRTKSNRALSWRNYDIEAIGVRCDIDGDAVIDLYAKGIETPVKTVPYSKTLLSQVRFDDGRLELLRQRVSHGKVDVPAIFGRTAQRFVYADQPINLEKNDFEAQSRASQEGTPVYTQKELFAMGELPAKEKREYREPPVIIGKNKESTIRKTYVQETQEVAGQDANGAGGQRVGGVGPKPGILDHPEPEFGGQYNDVNGKERVIISGRDMKWVGPARFESLNFVEIDDGWYHATGPLYDHFADNFDGKASGKAYIVKARKNSKGEFSEYSMVRYKLSDKESQPDTDAKKPQSPSANGKKPTILGHPEPEYAESKPPAIRRPFEDPIKAGYDDAKKSAEFYEGLKKPKGPIESEADGVTPTSPGVTPPTSAGTPPIYDPYTGGPAGTTDGTGAPGGGRPPARRDGFWKRNWKKVLGAVAGVAMIGYATYNEIDKNNIRYDTGRNTQQIEQLVDKYNGLDSRVDVIEGKIGEFGAVLDKYVDDWNSIPELRSYMSVIDELRHDYNDLKNNTVSKIYVDLKVGEIQKDLQDLQKALDEEVFNSKARDAMISGAGMLINIISGIR